MEFFEVINSRYESIIFILVIFIIVLLSILFILIRAKPEMEYKILGKIFGNKWLFILYIMLIIIGLIIWQLIYTSNIPNFK